MRTELGPGVWEVDGELQLDAVTLCAAQGFPPTPENQETVVQAARIVFSELPVEVRDAPVPRCLHPKCPRPIPPSKVACGRHFRLLPQPIRDAFWKAYKPGQVIATSTIPAHVQIIRACELWWTEREVEG